MHNKMQHRTRVELSQLKSGKIRECYSKKLHIAKIDPPEDLEEHAEKTEVAIKKAAEATFPESRSAKKPGYPKKH